MRKNTKTKEWPKDCIWPEPLKNGEGFFWEPDMVEESKLDDTCRELLEIRDYYDGLVEEGRLDEEYFWNWEYEGEDGELGPEDFVPEKGEEYWVDGFALDRWEEDLAEAVNYLKVDFTVGEIDLADEIRRITGYEFINENLLRQAFTRRGFALEYGLGGSYEELEFIGDSVLNTIVTREIARQLSIVDRERTDAPFVTEYDEGDFSRIRSRFVSKEHLAARASELGLDGFILYGPGEEPSESIREDVMEALIGAAAIDSEWDWEELESLVDRLVSLQLTQPDKYLKQTYYEILNAWHQRHFGRIPEYEVYRGCNRWSCMIRFQVPENDKGEELVQRLDVEADTRSEAREKAAEFAQRFLVMKGLWMNLADSGILPDRDNSINQLQELWQKKYLDEAPEYEFREAAPDLWWCDCRCGGVTGHGSAGNKTRAKKKAAYMVLLKLFNGGWEWLETVTR